MPSPDDQCCVYYISDASCTDPFCHGYIGLTANKTGRIAAHRRSGRFPAGFTVTVLHEGTRRECADVEKKYRPERGIGWNSDLGGGRWRVGRVRQSARNSAMK
jgi:hypothetical protein